MKRLSKKALTILLALMLIITNVYTLAFADTDVDSLEPTVEVTEPAEETEPTEASEIDIESEAEPTESTPSDENIVEIPDESIVVASEEDLAALGNNRPSLVIGTTYININDIPEDRKVHVYIYIYDNPGVDHIAFNLGIDERLNLYADGYYMIGFGNDDVGGSFGTSPLNSHLFAIDFLADASRALSGNFITVVAQLPDNYHVGDYYTISFADSDDGPRVPHFTYEGVQYPGYSSFGGITSGGIVITNSSTNYSTPAESGASAFVERLYTEALGRPSEKGGKIYWVNRISNGSATGFDVAREFLFSSEFKNLNLSDADFISVLYRVFFNRDADSSGKFYWVYKMMDGMDRYTVFLNFVNSTEWMNICRSYGIASGAIVNGAASDRASAFVTRLYTQCLGREAEVSGLTYWTTRLTNQTVTAREVARTFFFGSEFANRNYSNSEFITRLYRTFMGREPEYSGLNYWITRINNGTSLNEVLNNFASCPEFASICQNYGIRA